MTSPDDRLVERLQRAREEHRPLAPLLRTRFDQDGSPDRLTFVRVLREAFGLSLAQGARVAGALDHPDNVVLEAELEAVLAGR